MDGWRVYQDSTKTKHEKVSFADNEPEPLSSSDDFSFVSL